jgi:hypothetical protein
VGTPLEASVKTKQRFGYNITTSRLRQSRQEDMIPSEIVRSWLIQCARLS